MLTEPELSSLLSRQRFGVLASVRVGGHPHLSTVVYSWDPDEGTVRVSSTADRLKVRQLRRNPRAALHTSPDPWSFAVAEGEAEVSEPARTPGDAVGLELLGLAPGAGPGPEERAAFLEQQVAESRVVVRLRVSRLYGTALEVPAAE
ncbi:pyridoxamine 5'-phosphate oxidase family protein [Streptomonospora wellingtoniae]|uniref:pyridoxamine 5'-phosphate oxidase family protein n=1 Tax=Streptomonospora wellingtoniae TaxID=3075544 RepID=UPI0028893A77|nr:TIGR03618 family F420-dependent PPOX class oxidoreductase [Streptomonospora sp. DSM 45055]